MFYGGKDAAFSKDDAGGEQSVHAAGLSLAGWREGFADEWKVGGCNAVIYYFPILFQNSIKQTHNVSLLLGGVNMFGM